MDDETLQMYIEESLDHLGDIESDLLTIEEGGADIDVDLVNNVFRAAHSIKGGAGFMGLEVIKDLAHHLENVLDMVRNKELVPDAQKISVLLNGFDELESLINDIDNSNEVDVSEHIIKLDAITKSAGQPEETADTKPDSSAEAEDTTTASEAKKQEKLSEKNVEVKQKSAPDTTVTPVVRKVAPVAAKIQKVPTKKSAGKKSAVAATKPQTSLRVNVDLLDTLMNLAGELVLSRNQLLQGISASNTKTAEASSQNIDLITSELQEAIMRTRMQPIGNIFNTFTRVVRDLSQQLGKTMDLVIEGKDVELDKTILESINDPLTHLVRNSVDHGIETPEIRELAGKDATGKIELKAFHEAGQVNIVIIDDGKGLDPDQLAVSAVEKGLMTEDQVDAMTDKQKTELIMLPGFSTAKEVTDVSGRGVGMDVVTTNIENLGGVIDLDSTLGKGTAIQIKLPLTLAIIPSQIASVGNERYAIPQVNLKELLRIPAGQVKDKIEKVGDAEVVRLRGELLPLLNLSKILGIEKKYSDPKKGEKHSDRRENIADRRSKQYVINEEGLIVETQDNLDKNEQSPNRDKKDRRYHSQSAVNIAVVSSGVHKYGLVVDQLHDSEEIVVKPVGRHLSNCKEYAGATIMGDGKVALILDISNLAQMAELESVSNAGKTEKEAKIISEAAKDQAALLTFKNGEDEHFAAPLNLVQRIERIKTADIETLGESKVIQYRGGALPLYELSLVADFKPLPEKEHREVIVFNIKQREIGLMVTPPVDAIEVTLNIDEGTLKQPAIDGSMIINEHTTLLVDIFEMVKILNPGWFKEEATVAEQMAESGKKTLLFAEDSAFFRSQVKAFMEEDGFIVLEAEDGLIAWELLKERADDIDLILTDLEMPNMDGFELTQKIKNDPKYSHFKVIALTSLASENHIKKGKKVGIDEYEIKLDRERLMKVIRKYLNLNQ